MLLDPYFAATGGTRSCYDKLPCFCFLADCCFPFFAVQHSLPSFAFAVLPPFFCLPSYLLSLLVQHALPACLRQRLWPPEADEVVSAEDPMPISLTKRPFRTCLSPRRLGQKIARAIIRVPEAENAD